MGLVGSLSPDQIRSFDSQGYLVVESFASNDEIESMMERMDQLLDRFDCSTASIFSTKNQKQHTDDYFYESAEKVSF